jgi:DNA-directed RNA polymerase subunit M/transcription elongation factor TFIIS
MSIQPPMHSIEDKNTIESLSQKAKLTIHLVSIFSPAIFLALLFSIGNPKSYPLAFLFSAIYTAFLYFLAGGFDWKEEDLPIIRIVFIWILGDLILALLCYGIWYSTRWAVAKIYHIPMPFMMGRLLPCQQASFILKIKTFLSNENQSPHKRALFNVGRILIALVIVIVVGVGIASLLPESWQPVVPAVIFLIIGYLVIREIDRNTKVTVLYYCKRCRYQLDSSSVAIKTMNVIPENLEAMTNCPYCHEHLEVQKITWDDALKIGWISSCEKCGKFQPKLGTKIGDQCPFCGAIFSDIHSKQL